MKNENLEEIKDRIAKNEGFENWISMTWQVNHTSYGLMWQKVANEILKENQELKARVQELENPLGGNYSPMQNMKNALKMVNEALQDGLAIEKNDPIHQVIERLL